MDKSIIIKKRIMENLESIWLSAPGVSMNQFLAFLYERSENLSLELSDQEWMELVSNYTGTDLRQWLDEREEAERRIHEANERYFELIKKREAKGTGILGHKRGHKRGLDALLPEYPCE